MLLQISTTHRPATDLGYLLHKNPANPQSVQLNFGTAHVFYARADAERCTAVLLVEVDPVGLVRGRRGGDGEGLLAQYVNDRPYAASSFLSVALAEVFGTALAGRSKERAQLADVPLPLEAKVAAVPCRGGAAVARRLFEPLGYTVASSGGPLDEQFAEWGDSPYHDLTLAGSVRLRELLQHLYVLLPVLDDDKHYWVGDAEVDKLVRHAEEWLPGHPDKDLIASRYLKHRRSLVRLAMQRLVGDETGEDVDASAESYDRREAALERPLSLNQQRIAAMLEALARSHATSVLDLGCGEGRFLAAALRDRRLVKIAGMDVSHRALEIAAERLGIPSVSSRDPERLRRLHGSLAYRDPRLVGYDAAVAIEVVEHLDPFRLPAFEQNLFACIAARTIVVTTPNREHNVLFPGLAAGKLRHADHRFEWTRAEFSAWVAGCAERHGYTVEIRGIGPDDPAHGAPTQMAVFTRAEALT